MPKADPLAVLAQIAVDVANNPPSSSEGPRRSTRITTAASAPAPSPAPAAPKRKRADTPDVDEKSQSDSDYEMVDTSHFEQDDSQSSPILVPAPPPASRPSSSRTPSSRSSASRAPSSQPKSSRNAQPKPPAVAGAPTQPPAAAAPPHGPFPMYPPGLPYYPGFPPGAYPSGPGFGPYPYHMPYPPPGLGFPPGKGATTAKASHGKQGPPATHHLPASASLAERTGGAQLRPVHRGADIVDTILAGSSADQDTGSDIEGPPELGEGESYFSLRVLLVRPKTAKAKAGTTTSSDPLFLGEGMTRVRLFELALKVHHLEKKYRALVDPHGGPSFEMYWKGSTGGKSEAETVVHDDKFNRLWTAWLRSGQPVLSVRIRLVDLAQFKMPDDDEPEDQFTAEPKSSKYDEPDTTITSIMSKLETGHKCPHNSHAGICVPDPNGIVPCIRLSLQTTRAWAMRVRDGKGNITELPENLYPKDTKPSRKALQQLPPPPVAPQSSISSDVLLALTLGRAIQPIPAPAPPPPPEVPDMRSSSPPAPPTDRKVDKDRLFQLLTKFREERDYIITVDQLMFAHRQFTEAGYTPDSFGCILVPRVQELSGFNEGTAASFLSFCHEYTARASGPPHKKQRRK